MVDIWTWNVGVMQSEFHARGPSVQNKLLILAELLDCHKPGLLLMQEWGLHEQGVPPDELKTLLPRQDEYTAVIDGPYVAMCRSTHWECKSHSWTQLSIPNREERGVQVLACASDHMIEIPCHGTNEYYMTLLFICSYNGSEFRECHHSLLSRRC